MLGTTSALLREDAGQGAVMGREAGCGTAAANLLTGRRDLCRLPGSAKLPPQRGPPRPCWTTQRSRSILELVFDTLVRWGPGTTWTWAGRSRPRWSSARSCSGSTSPPVRELAAKVEPYLRADGTRIWSLTQLERQLRPEVYGRRRGGYLDRKIAQFRRERDRALGI